MKRGMDKMKKSSGKKGLRNYISMVTATAIVSVPSFALAATSPEAKVNKALNGGVDLLTGIAFGAATLAAVWYLFNMYFAGSHEKAELKGSLKTVGVVTCLIPIANIVIKWIGGFFA